MSRTTLTPEVDGRTERWDYDPIVQSWPVTLQLVFVDRYGEGRTIFKVSLPFGWLRRWVERWVRA